MKVRFYRGPMDGKTGELRDNETAIKFARAPNFRNTFRAYGDHRDFNFEFQTDTYHRTRHSHPDGSVYFEWDRPRGTRIKR